MAGDPTGPVGFSTESAGDTEAARPAAGPVLLGVASAALVGSGLLVTESVGEVAVDIDLKPSSSSLPVAVSGFDIPTLSVGLGAATGEGLLAVVGTYELDDPVGFLGYVLGITAFVCYLEEVASDSTTPGLFTVAAVLGALVQAAFEGFAFLVFESSVGASRATVSLLGNTVSHGVLLGAIPLVVSRPLYQPYLERPTE